MRNFDRCEKEHLTEPENENDYENECENCGAPCAKTFCCRACYKIAEADYKMDQEK